MYYKGKIIKLTNPQKYIGDVGNIVYRSIWERNVMRWCDSNTNVVKWASEEIAITYDNPIKGSVSRYYPDFFIEYSNGDRKIIEIKPRFQTEPPTKPSRATQKYLTEVATYAINQEKWKAAKTFCDKNKIKFEVWTEDTLKMMGIPTSATAKTDKKPESKRPKMIPMVTRPKRKS